ncbi:transforming growth factor-beta-induced protein ig-h3 isoform X1 [Parasteatoda tepidariorum]|uniref:transforming growth factor-beta-induced protein ig-h3 isoform X1 n=1 Tax=Parasteatoda tepidariorum TaxID=114398 RepID=UPI001C71B654|nr:transforming growth factor-beta-induced protein ig-h3 isoform X1 [Parasteatoda tepidariorum]
MGALEMVDIVKEVGMKNVLHSGNFTIFCPQNAAMETFVEDQELISENEVVRNYNFRSLKKKTLKNLIKKHMVKGFLKIDDFHDEQKIGTEDGNNQTRINIYYVPEKVVTVNCVPIITADYFARNGIIHLVEKVLPKPIKTVADIIAGDSQFSVLKGMLSRAGLVQTLRNPNKTFTVFAPSDSVFKRAPQSKEERKNDRCTSRLMKHHIIDHVICSQAIPQFAKSSNLIGELLSLSRSEDNKLYVDDIQIVVKDLIATNGVVHVIDGLLSTKQASTVSQVMEKYGLGEFLSLIKMANLGYYFDALENVTYFVPSDDSIKKITPSHLESFMYDAEALREVLLYHIGVGQPEINAQEQELRSRLENTSLRIQVHASYPHSAPQVLVQCAEILSTGNKICGGTLHVINKVLLPPKLSLMQLLENIEGFSTLVLLLRVTGLENRLKDPNARQTILAPTDDAFHLMGQSFLFRLLDDLNFASDLVKMHILSGTVCCSQLKADFMAGRRLVRAVDGSSLPISRTREGTLTVFDARLVDCDIMATNGAVHMVDAVFLQKMGDGAFIRI